MTTSRNRLLGLVILLLSVVQSMGPTLAGSVLDRIKSENALHCGGAPRPGLLDVEPEGKTVGMFRDLCKAIAAAVLGSGGRVVLREYESETSYDGVRNGEDEIYFLSGSEILSQGLSSRILPGPPIFYETIAIMVPEASSVRHVADLAGQLICFPQGSGTHRALEAWFEAAHLPFQRMGYQEDVEMLDAYHAGACRALAGETTSLARARLEGGADASSRIIYEPLAAFPILAGTPTHDAQWSAIVAWTIFTLMRAETPTLNWAAGGIASIPLDGQALGLASDWQKRVVDTAGSYGDIYRRNLGSGSPYDLQRGLNAPWQAGGAMLAPYSE